MTTRLTTPVGRIVWGHPTKARPKIDKDTKRPKTKADGSPAMQRAFGLAIPKEAALRQRYAGDPNLEQIVATSSFERCVWPFMVQEVATKYPVNPQNGMPQVPSKFSWKMTDCDEIDDQGKRYGEREGYEGCIVLAISSELPEPPHVFKLNGQAYDQLPADAIKCGDFAAIGIDLEVNVPTDRTHTPGLYVNPKAIEFVGYGTEIISVAAANPNEFFGGVARQLPPGASATPVGGSAPMPGMGGGMPQQPMPQQGGYPQPQQGGYPQPQPMPQQGGYPQPQQPMPQQPMPQPGGYPQQPAPMPQQGGYAPQPGQPMPPMGSPGGPQPAHDFAQGGMPQPQPGGYPQQPAPMPQQGGYPQPGQPMPGQMPGMMPGR